MQLSYCFCFLSTCYQSFLLTPSPGPENVSFSPDFGNFGYRFLQKILDIRVSIGGTCSSADITVSSFSICKISVELSSGCEIGDISQPWC